jgi:hypothetical protein
LWALALISTRLDGSREKQAWKRLPVKLFIKLIPTREPPRRLKKTKKAEAKNQKGVKKMN